MNEIQIQALEGIGITIAIVIMILMIAPLTIIAVDIVTEYIEKKREGKKDENNTRNSTDI